MAVPKKRTSHGKKAQRSSCKFIRLIQHYHDSLGNPCLSHRIDSNGWYKGRLVIIKKVKENSESEPETDSGYNLTQ
jgi:ribosomal protein L32